MNQKDPIYKICGVNCPRCHSYNEVAYVWDGYTFIHKGPLYICDDQLVYHNEWSFNGDIVNYHPKQQEEEGIQFQCANCGEELNFDYDEISSTGIDTVQIDHHQDSLRPLLSHCTGCNTYSCVNVECDIGINHSGYLCRDEHQRYVLFADEVEDDDVRVITLSFECCGRVIDNDKMNDLILEDRMIHSVEAVDIFADFWPPPIPPGPPADPFTRFDLLDI